MVLGMLALALTFGLVLALTGCDNGSKTSTGTVQSISGQTFTLSPSGGSDTFTVTVSGTGITGFQGSVTWDGEDTAEESPTTTTTTPVTTAMMTTAKEPAAEAR